MKVVLETQSLEDAELRAITGYLSGGKRKRRATREEARQFLQAAIDEALVVALAGPPVVPVPTVGSAAPGPDGDVLAEVDVVVEGGSEDEVLTALDELKAHISAGEEFLSAEDLLARGPEVLEP